jgi:hypothetical protein
MFRHSAVSIMVMRQSRWGSPRVSMLSPKPEMNRRRCAAVVEEKFLDDVRLVAEAQDEISVPGLAVALH